MSDRFAERLVRVLRDAYPADRAYRRSDLVRSDGPLPESVAHFLIHDLWTRTRDHVDRIESDSWIDGSHEPVQRALEELQDGLSDAVHFPAEAWDERLRTAVEHLCAYLRDPVGALTRYVFDETSTLPVGTVLRRMGYFRPYPYFENVLEAYLERKSIKILDRNRFEKVLRRIERELASDYGIEQWNRVFDPVFALADPLGGPERPVRVPAAVLQDVASAREFSDLVQRLNEVEGQALTREELTGHIEKALRPEVEESPSEPADRPSRSSTGRDEKTSRPDSTETASRAETANTEGESSGPSSDRTDVSPDDEDDPPPRWKKFQRPERSRGADVDPQRTKPEPNGDEDAPLWKKFQRPSTARGDVQASRAPDDTPAERRNPAGPSGNGGPQTAEPGSLDQLEAEIIGTIPSDQRRRFVDKLFDGSTDKYEHTLRRLEQVGSWQQASSLIAEEVFIPHKVDIYSEPAVTFTDLVEARYREETAS